MPPRRDESPRGSRVRIAALAVGTVLAVAATGTLVLTDNPRVLRVAVVVALWAFVIGAMAGVRRRPDGPADFAPGAELELRRAYQAELERETADRREFQAWLAADLRRGLGDGVRPQGEGLRGDGPLREDQGVGRLGGGAGGGRGGREGEGGWRGGGSPRACGGGPGGGGGARGGAAAGPPGGGTARGGCRSSGATWGPGRGGSGPACPPPRPCPMPPSRPTRRTGRPAW